jgi:allantoinase
MERDLRGYAQQPPKARWPNGARVALQFVLNYEEGSILPPIIITFF